ncbi:MAG: carotenoid oxygenase family protein, partial [Proteobacteria bacterium]|nr:carotenoid oxygenase family protein [Pseudomonadota bacterium]
VVHFANAFDVDDATLAVDLCSFETYVFGHEFGFQGAKRPLDPALPDSRPPQRLYRATVRDGSDTATWHALSDCGLDFPRVHPDREGLDAPAIYASTRADRSKSDPFDSIARIDTRDLERPTEVWTAGEHQFVGEPVFAPRPGAPDPDDGWVIALVSDGLAKRTDVCVFESKRVANGPVASVSLPLQPYGFHGTWEAA